MKICLLSRYFDFRNAGLGRVGLEIRNELERRGHEVVCVSTEGTSLYAYFWYTATQIPFKLPKADVYHAITPMEAMWLPKNKSVVTFHDLFQITNPDALGSKISKNTFTRIFGCHYFWLAATLATHCKYITAVSEKTRDDLNKHFHIPRKQIKVIHSGIREDLDYLPTLPLSKDWEDTDPFNTPLEPITIGYIGQLDRRKRVDLLVTMIRASSFPVHALIAGTGPEDTYLKKLANGDPRITFLGRLPDAELVDFYNSLDVFFFPTRIEGYGLPIVEAMACKKPVIIMEDAILPPEIKERCTDIPYPTHPHLLHWLNDADKIEDNYQWAKKHTWKATVDEYVKIYEEIYKNG